MSKIDNNEPVKFRDVTVMLSENGWILLDGTYGLSERSTGAKWIAKTPQEIAEIFTKYAIKPALYGVAK